MVYCSYTDREWPIEETTEEHVVPLALGGSDQFVTRVHSKSNSDIGSRIDGELAKEFVVNSLRARHDARGHSGKEPSIDIRATEALSGAPLNLRWGRRVQVFDPIAGRTVRRATDFKLRLDIDRDTRLRFLAKVFLSGGYLVYEDLFRASVEHRHPRLLLTRAPRDMSADEYASIRMQFLEWWNNDLPNGAAGIFKLQSDIARILDASFVVFKPGKDNLEVFGGVLGAYLGMLKVPADTSAFPRAGVHDLGHAVLVKRGQVRRLSLRTLLKEVMPRLEALWLFEEASGR